MSMRPDAGVRVRAAQGRAPDHVVVPQVAGVGELAGDLERAVGPQRAVADPPGAGAVGDGRRWSAVSRGRSSSAWPPLGGQADRVEDLLVAGAAAEVAGQRLADLGVRRRSGAGEQVVRGDDEARACRSRTARRRRRRRPAAPGAARSPSARPSTVDDLAALRLAGGDQAGADRLAVEVDGAGAALALLAGVLGAGQAQPLAQHVEQALARPDVVDRLLGAVDGEGHAHASGRLPVVVPGPGAARRAITASACRR